METSFFTLKNDKEAYLEIERSKFIANAKCVEDENDAIAFIKRIKSKYSDATHNCYAYSVGIDSMRQKSSDDGEPGGTAGQPILEAININNVKNVVIVVARYFGGIKLGAGGLVRAYKNSAMTVLTDNMQMKYFGSFINLTTNYSIKQSVENYLNKEKDVRILEIQYDEAVIFKLFVKEEVLTKFKENVTNISCGESILSELRKGYDSLKD